MLTACLLDVMDAYMHTRNHSHACALPAAFTYVFFAYSNASTAPLPLATSGVYAQ